MNIRKMDRVAAFVGLIGMATLSSAACRTTERKSVGGAQCLDPVKARKILSGRSPVSDVHFVREKNGAISRINLVEHDDANPGRDRLTQIDLDEGKIEFYWRDELREKGSQGQLLKPHFVAAARPAINRSKYLAEMLDLHSRLMLSCPDDSYSREALVAMEFVMRYHAEDKTR